MSKTKLQTGSGVLALIVLTLFMVWVHSTTTHERGDTVSGLPLAEGTAVPPVAERSSVPRIANGGRLNAPDAVWSVVPPTISTGPRPPSATPTLQQELYPFPRATPDPTEMARRRELEQLARIMWFGKGTVIMRGSITPDNIASEYEVEEVPLGRTYNLDGLHGPNTTRLDVQKIPATADTVWRVTVFSSSGPFYMGNAGWSVSIDGICLGMVAERGTTLAAIVYDRSLLHEGMVVSPGSGLSCP
jgi:hypothetical protein